MKLYEINSRAQEIFNLLEPDPDSGALKDGIDVESLIEELNTLDRKHENIIMWMVEQYLNLKSEAASIKSEEERLYKIRKSKESAIERFLCIIDRECGGGNADFGIAKLSHRKSVQTIVYDREQAVRFCSAHGHLDCIKTVDPDIRKDVIKSILKSGIDIPGVRIEENITISLK